MSDTSVNQRPKGQGNKVSVQNSSIHQKDAVNDDDFVPYLSSQTNQSNSYPPMSDPYMPSYYAPSNGFPYFLGEAAWSTAGDPPMPYLTTYGPMSNLEHRYIPDGVSTFMKHVCRNWTVNIGLMEVNAFLGSLNTLM